MAKKKDRFTTKNPDKKKRLKDQKPDPPTIYTNIFKNIEGKGKRIKDISD